MAVTIREVSERCGLSVSLVSKALNNYPDVREETRQRVLEAAHALGYIPNSLARGLKTNRTYNVGVILDDELHDNLLHTYFSILLNGFKREAEQHEYDVTLIGNRAVSYVAHCRHRNLDGVCLMCVDFYNPGIVELVRSEISTVTIDHLFTGKDCVMSDNRSGIRALLQYAYDRGHRRIAYIHGTSASVTDVRLAAYYDFMHEHGIEPPPDSVIPSHYHSTRHAYESMKRLLSLSDRPTCVLMTDDYSALGGIEAVHDAGFRVPEDISIVGYDGIALIQKIRPRLTTLYQNGEIVGRQAAVRLIHRIEHPESPVERPDVIAGSLLEGETVLDLRRND